jgi:hypothetical protein
VPSHLMPRWRLSCINIVAIFLQSAINRLGWTGGENKLE